MGNALLGQKISLCLTTLWRKALPMAQNLARKNKVPAKAAAIS
jgi:hypothetical protein